MEPTNEQVTTTTEQVSTQPDTSSVEAKTDTQNVDTQNTQTETLMDSQPEGATTQVSTPEGVSTPTEDKTTVVDKPAVSDEIKKKLDRLAEYEVKEKELIDLKERLGVKDTIQDNQIFSAQQQLDIIENQMSQEYIRLCNKYGVDYRPDKIDASGKELREKDPQAFYELKFQLENLNNAVEAKRQEVQNFVHQREIQTALARNQKVLQASPAINQVIDTLIKEDSVDASQIDNIVNYGLLVAREAFEMGRQAVLNEKAAVKPAQVLNNTTISQQAQSTPTETKTLTLEDVKNMDIETYKKHQHEIDKLFLG